MRSESTMSSSTRLCRTSFTDMDAVCVYYIEERMSVRIRIFSRSNASSPLTDPLQFRCHLLQLFQLKELFLYEAYVQISWPEYVHGKNAS